MEFWEAEEPITPLLQHSSPPILPVLHHSSSSSRLLKNSVCRLLKKTQRRGARKIDKRRRTCRYVAARRLNATKPMRLFQQPARYNAWQESSAKSQDFLRLHDDLSGGRSVFEENALLSYRANAGRLGTDPFELDFDLPIVGRCHDRFALFCFGRRIDLYSHVIQSRPGGVFNLRQRCHERTVGDAIQCV